MTRVGDHDIELARGMSTAAWASIGAGLIHAAAVGIHAEHKTLVVVFSVLALFQAGVGVMAMERPGRSAALGGALVNIVAVAGWLLTRTTGISFISGLEAAESPQAADTLCALLGLVAVAACWSTLAPGAGRVARERLPLFAVLVLTMGGLATVKVHTHSHETVDAAAESAFFIDDNGALVLKIAPTTVVAEDTVPAEKGNASAAGDETVTVPTDPATTTTAPHKRAPKPTPSTAPPTTVHTHETTPAAVLAAASGWPRTWDPAKGLDVFANVGGVSPDQETRARSLVAAAERDLPKWANYADAVAAGWKSIADNQTTGYEHLVNQKLINDGKFLDSTAPESLVYKVVNGTKTLVSAMFISPTGTSLTDPLLTDYAGPLMQWHIHNNLCFKTGLSGSPVVAGLTDVLGNCPAGTVKQTDGSPMVHVWIVAHPCGPFAAVEGVAAGLASVPDAQRLDLCKH